MPSSTSMPRPMPKRMQQTSSALSAEMLVRHQCCVPVVPVSTTKRVATCHLGFLSSWVRARLKGFIRTRHHCHPHPPRLCRGPHSSARPQRLGPASRPTAHNGKSTAHISQGSRGDHKQTNSLVNLHQTASCWDNRACTAPHPSRRELLQFQRPAKKRCSPSKCHPVALAPLPRKAVNLAALPPPTAPAPSSQSGSA